MNAPVSPPTATRHCKVAIIGTGFSGLGMAIRLRRDGRTVVTDAEDDKLEAALVGAGPAAVRRTPP